MSANLQRYRDATFHFYPANMVLALVPTVDLAEAAIGRLLGAGHPDKAIHAWYDRPGEEALDAEGHQHGSAAALWRSLQTLTGEREMIDRYERELRLGQICIGVQCDAREQALQAVTALEGSEGRYVNYCTTGAIERFPTPYDEEYQRQPGAVGEGGR